MTSGADDQPSVHGPSAEGFVSRHDRAGAMVVPFGSMRWLYNAELTPGATMTLGRVVIDPGLKNPLHTHPDCEEMLYLISGELEHRVGEDRVRMGPGDAIRVPAGELHDARSVGTEPAVMIVCYGSPTRQIVHHDEPG